MAEEGEMNLSKGFDRIFILISIVVFCWTTAYFFINTEYPTGYKLLSRWKSPNPEYSVWDEQHGDEWRKTHDIFGHPRNIMEFRDGELKPVYKKPIPYPPKRYLPTQNHIRILFSILAGLATSITCFMVLAVLSRSLRFIIRWIASGFKD